MRYSERRVLCAYHAGWDRDVVHAMEQGIRQRLQLATAWYKGICNCRHGYACGHVLVAVVQPPPLRIHNDNDGICSGNVVV